MTDWYKIKRVLTWVNEVKLPAEYQEVEYIQSSWTQWIDTLITPNSNTKLQAKLSRIQNNDYVDIWYYAWNDLQDWRLFVRSEWEWTLDIPWWSWSWNRLVWPMSTDWKVFELEVWNYYIKDLISQQTYTWTASTFTWYSTIKLSRNQSTNRNNSDRFYYVKIREWDTMVRDFYPCYRKSDWVIWMYDLVNDQFYTNSWTWIFTKWDDVPGMVEKQIYPVENWIVLDFQHNWLSWCTLSDTTYASIVAWEWISMSWTTIDDYWTEIKLPSSVYWKAIKQVILNCYYPTSWYWAWKWFWCIKNGSYGFRYSREEYEQNNIWFSDGQTTAQNIWLMTWEITITMNFWDWVISWTVNNTSFSVSNSAANTIRDSFIDWTFRLWMVSWRTSAISYLRKATIITE